MGFFPPIFLSVFSVLLYKNNFVSTFVPWVHLLTVSISSRNFQVMPFMFRIQLAANRGTLTSFPILFSFFYKHYMLNKSRKSRHSCPVPDFKDNASSFSLFSMTFAVILWCSTFIVLKCISCITRFSRFCHKRLLQFVHFLHSLRWLCDFWIWFSTFIDLHWLNYLWFYGIKLLWPWWIIFLSLSCIQFVFFFENFTTYFYLLVNSFPLGLVFQPSLGIRII